MAKGQLAGPDGYPGGTRDSTNMAVAQYASTGSPGAEPIAELFATLESPLLGYALRYVPDIDMAQDLVQEAFLRLHAQFDQVREPRRWLYRTVHNLALNHRRDESRVVPLDAPTSDGGQPPAATADLQPLPDEQIARWESIGLVRLSLQNLDARSRELLTLKFNEDLSYKDISARTGLTVGHVGYLLHHSLKALAAELAKAGLVP
jgi:RNA polymerase sigma-70 factor (ECF subfamily)